MFENIISKVLNTTVGKFLKDVSADQLKISLGGKLTLKDIEIRGEAFDFLKLPVSIKLGKVGLIHVELSWTGLTSVPVKVLVQDVHLVVTPAKDSDVDEAEIAAKILKQKIETLDNWELLNFPEKEIQEDSKGFLMRTVDTIVDHVTVKVDRVHVVFEGPNVNLGVGIGGVVVNPTDADWTPVTKCIDTTVAGRRAIAVNDVCVYFNTPQNVDGAAMQAALDSVMSSDSASSEPAKGSTAAAKGSALAAYNAKKTSSAPALASAPSSASTALVTAGGFPSDASAPGAPAVKSLLPEVDYAFCASLFDSMSDPRWSYLLPPFSASCKLTMHKGSLEALQKLSPPQPAIAVEAHLTELSLAIQKNQYQGILLLLAQLSHSPAALAMLEQQQEESLAQLKLKSELDEARRIALATRGGIYAELYKRNFQGYPELPEPDVKQLKEIEKEEPIANILAWRAVALKIVQLEYDQQDKPFWRPQPAKGIFSGWFGPKGPAKPAHTADPALVRRMLLDPAAVRHEEEEKAIRNVSAHYVKISVSAKVDAVSLKLMSPTREPLLALSVTDIGADVLLRPHSIAVGAKVGSIEAVDHMTPNTAHKVFIRRARRPARGGDAPADQPLVAAVVSVNDKAINPDEGLDLRLGVRLTSIDVIVNTGMLLQLAKFFEPPAEAKFMGAAKEKAMARFTEVRGSMQSAAVAALENRGRNLMDVIVDGPTIIIPTRPTDPESHILVVDLGCLTFKSAPPSMADIKQQKVLLEKAERDANVLAELPVPEQVRYFYDSFNVALSDLSVYAGAPEKLYKPDASVFIVNPFGLTVGLNVCLINAAQANADAAIAAKNDGKGRHVVLALPQTIVSVNLPKIELTVSPLKVARLLRLVKALLSTLKADADALARAKAIERAQGPSLATRINVELDAVETENAAKAAKEAAAATTAVVPATAGADKAVVDAAAPAAPAAVNPESIVIALDLKLGLVGLTITNDLDPTNPIDVLMLGVKDIAVDFTMRPLDMDIKASLGSVLIEDRLSSAKHGTDVTPDTDFLLRTTGVPVTAFSGPFARFAPANSPFSDRANVATEAFLAAGVELVQRASPLYAFADTVVNAQFGRINLGVNRETLPPLMFFFIKQLMPSKYITNCEEATQGSALLEEEPVPAAAAPKPSTAVVEAKKAPKVGAALAPVPEADEDEIPVTIDSDDHDLAVAVTEDVVSSPAEGAELHYDEQDAGDAAAAEDLSAEAAEERDAARKRVAAREATVEAMLAKLRADTITSVELLQLHSRANVQLQAQLIKLRQELVAVERSGDGFDRRVELAAEISRIEGVIHTRRSRLLSLRARERVAKAGARVFRVSSGVCEPSQRVGVLVVPQDLSGRSLSVQRAIETGALAFAGAEPCFQLPGTEGAVAPLYRASAVSSEAVESNGYKVLPVAVLVAATFQGISVSLNAGGKGVIGLALSDFTAGFAMADSGMSVRAQLGSLTVSNLTVRKNSKVSPRSYVDLALGSEALADIKAAAAAAASNAVAGTTIPEGEAGDLPDIPAAANVDTFLAAVVDLHDYVHTNFAAPAPEKTTRRTLGRATAQLEYPEIVYTSACKTAARLAAADGSAGAAQDCPMLLDVALYMRSPEPVVLDDVDDESYFSFEPARALLMAGGVDEHTMDERLAEGIVVMSEEEHASVGSGPIDIPMSPARAGAASAAASPVKPAVAASTAAPAAVYDCDFNVPSLAVASAASRSTNVRFAHSIVVSARFSGLRVVGCYKFVDTALAWVKDIDAVVASITAAPATSVAAVAGAAGKAQSRLGSARGSVKGSANRAGSVSKPFATPKRELATAAAAGGASPAPAAAEAPVKPSTTSLAAVESKPLMLISLSVEIADLAVAVPVSSTSPELLCVQLGSIKVSNKVKIPKASAVAKLIASAPGASASAVAATPSGGAAPSPQFGPRGSGIGAGGASRGSSPIMPPSRLSLAGRRPSALMRGLSQRTLGSVGPSSASMLSAVPAEDEGDDDSDADFLDIVDDGTLIAADDAVAPELSGEDAAAAAHAAAAAAIASAAAAAAKREGGEAPAVTVGELVEYSSIQVEYKVSLTDLLISSVCYVDVHGGREQSAAPRVSHQVTLRKIDFVQINAIMLSAAQHIYAPLLTVTPGASAATEPAAEVAAGKAQLYVTRHSQQKPLALPDWVVEAAIPDVNVIFSQPHMSLALSLLVDDTLYPGLLKETNKVEMGSFDPPMPSSAKGSAFYRAFAEQQRKGGDSKPVMGLPGKKRAPGAAKAGDAPAVNRAGKRAGIMAVTIAEMAKLYSERALGPAVTEADMHRTEHAGSKAGSNIGSRILTGLTSAAKSLGSKLGSKLGSRAGSRNGAGPGDDWGINGKSGAVAADGSAAAAKPLTFAVQFELQQLAVQLVTNPCQLASQSMALVLSLYANAQQSSDKGLRVLAEVSDICMVNAMLSSANPEQLRREIVALPATTAIIKPFSVVVQMAQTDSPIAVGAYHTSAAIVGASGDYNAAEAAVPAVAATQRLSAFVGLTDIDLKLTYNDYELVFAVLGTLSMPPKSADDSEGDAAAKPAAEEEVEAPLLPVTPEGVLKYSFGDMAVRVALNRVSIVLVNDAPGFPLPFARFDVEGTSVALDAFAHKRTINVRTSVRGDFHNGSLVQWEPLMEPATFAVTLDECVTQPMRVSVRTEGRMDFNITRAMMDGLAQSLELLTAAQKAQAKRLRARQAALSRAGSTIRGSARSSARGSARSSRVSNASTEAFSETIAGSSVPAAGFSFFRLNNGTELPVQYCFGLLPPESTTGIATTCAIGRSSLVLRGGKSLREKLRASAKVFRAKGPRAMRELVMMTMEQELALKNGGYLPATEQAAAFAAKDSKPAASAADADEKKDEVVIAEVEEKPAEASTEGETAAADEEKPADAEGEKPDADAEKEESTKKEESVKKDAPAAPATLAAPASVPAGASFSQPDALKLDRKAENRLMFQWLVWRRVCSVELEAQRKRKDFTKTLASQSSCPLFFDDASSLSSTGTVGDCMRSVDEDETRGADGRTRSERLAAAEAAAAADRRRALDKPLQRLINIQIGGYLPLCNVAVDSVGAHTRQLQPGPLMIAEARAKHTGEEEFDEAALSHSVILEVSVVNGVKTIAVHSASAVVNLTDTPLLFNDAPLMPGAHRYLPLTYRLPGFSVRPASKMEPALAAATHEPSAEIPFHELATGSVVQCAALSEGEAPFTAVVQSWFRQGCQFWALTAPVAITNLLSEAAVVHVASVPAHGAAKALAALASKKAPEAQTPASPATAGPTSLAGSKLASAAQSSTAAFIAPTHAMRTYGGAPLLTKGANGKEGNLFALEIKVPALGVDWSEPVLLDNKTSATRSIKCTDRAGRSIVLLAEISYAPFLTAKGAVARAHVPNIYTAPKQVAAPESAAEATGFRSACAQSATVAAGHGTVMAATYAAVKVVLYAPFWVFDTSNLGVIIGESREVTASRMCLTQAKLIDTAEDTNEKALRSMRAAAAKSQAREGVVETSDRVAAAASVFNQAASGGPTTAVDVLESKLWSRATMYAPSKFSAQEATRVSARLVKPKFQRKLEEGTPAAARGVSPFKSEWSEEFSISAVGSSTILTLASTQTHAYPLAPRVQDKTIYQVAVLVRAGQGAFRRTKFVYFSPRYTIVNRLPLPILVRQHHMEDLVALKTQTAEAAALKSAIEDERKEEDAPAAGNWLVTRNPTDAPADAAAAAADSAEAAQTVANTIQHHVSAVSSRTDRTEVYLPYDDCEAWHYPYSKQKRLVAFRMLTPEDPVAAPVAEAVDALIAEAVAAEKKAVEAELEKNRLAAKAEQLAEGLYSDDDDDDEAEDGQNVVDALDAIVLGITTADLRKRPPAYVAQHDGTSTISAKIQSKEEAAAAARAARAADKAARAARVAANAAKATADKAVAAKDAKKADVSAGKIANTSKSDAKGLSVTKPWEDGEWGWSGYIDIDCLGDSTLTLRNTATHQSFVANVRVLMTAPDVKNGNGNGVTVVIEPQNISFPRYRVENRTSCDTFRFAQAGNQDWTTLAPYQTAVYTWDQPLGTHELEVSILSGLSTINKTFVLEEPKSLGRITVVGSAEADAAAAGTAVASTPVSLNRAVVPSAVVARQSGGVNPVVNASAQRATHDVFVSVVAEGPTRVLVISDFPLPEASVDLVTHQLLSTPLAREAVQAAVDKYSIGLRGGDALNVADARAILGDLAGDDAGPSHPHSAEARRERLAASRAAGGVNLSELYAGMDLWANHSDDVAAEFHADGPAPNAGLSPAELDRIIWDAGVDANDGLSASDIAVLVRLRAQAVSAVKERHTRVEKQKALVGKLASLANPAVPGAGVNAAIESQASLLATGDVAYLCVRVEEARWLTAAGSDGLSDCYAMLTFHDQSYKTEIASRTLNPYWNTELFFKIEGELLAALRESASSEESDSEVVPVQDVTNLESYRVLNKGQLKIAVFSKNRITSDTFLGGVIVGNLACVARAQAAYDTARYAAFCATAEGLQGTPAVREIKAVRDSIATELENDAASKKRDAAKSAVASGVDAFAPEHHMNDDDAAAAMLTAVAGDEESKEDDDAPALSASTLLLDDAFFEAATTEAKPCDMEPVKFLSRWVQLHAVRQNKRLHGQVRLAVGFAPSELARQALVLHELQADLAHQVALLAQLTDKFGDQLRDIDTGRVNLNTLAFTPAAAVVEPITPTVAPPAKKKKRGFFSFCCTSSAPEEDDSAAAAGSINGGGENAPEARPATSAAPTAVNVSVTRSEQRLTGAAHRKAQAELDAIIKELADAAEKRRVAAARLRQEYVLTASLQSVQVSVEHVLDCLHAAGKTLEASWRPVKIHALVQCNGHTSLVELFSVQLTSMGFAVFDAAASAAEAAEAAAVPASLPSLARGSINTVRRVLADSPEALPLRFVPFTGIAPGAIAVKRSVLDEDEDDGNAAEESRAEASVSKKPSPSKKGEKEAELPPGTRGVALLPQGPSIDLSFTVPLSLLLPSANGAAAAPAASLSLHLMVETVRDRLASAPRAVVGDLSAANVAAGAAAQLAAFGGASPLSAGELGMSSPTGGMFSPGSEASVAGSGPLTAASINAALATGAADGVSAEERALATAAAIARGDHSAGKGTHAHLPFTSETAYVSVGEILVPLRTAPFVDPAAAEAAAEAAKAGKPLPTRDSLGREIAGLMAGPVWHFGSEDSVLPAGKTVRKDGKPVAKEAKKAAAAPAPAAVAWSAPPVMGVTRQDIEAAFKAAGMKVKASDATGQLRLHTGIPAVQDTLALQETNARNLRRSAYAVADNDDSDDGDDDEEEAAAPAAASAEGALPVAPIRALVSCSLALAKPLVDRETMVVDLSVEHVGLSLVDSGNAGGKAKEVLYVSVEGVKVGLTESIATRGIELSVHCVQVDHQSSIVTAGPDSDAIVFGPSEDAMATGKPFIHIGLSQTKTSDDYPVQVFKYATVLVQEMEVTVDESLIWELLGVINDILPGLVTEPDPTQYLLLDKRITWDTDGYANASKFYFSLLHIQPLQVYITFRANPDLREGSETMAFNPVQAIFSAASGVLGSIDSAPVCLNSLMIQDAYGDVATLMQPITQFYVTQGISQGYKILGSVEFLGNPVSLVNGVGGGVKDFFYEPAQGLVSSPKDFGTGIAKGTGSLVTSVTSGVFGAASKITGSAGSGVAALTMDADFQAQRRARGRRQVRHAGDGLSEGAKAFGTGLFSGIKGIVADPLKGARQGGVGGFFKGVGLGLTGVVTKTVSGAVDLVTSTLQGIGATFSLLSTLGEEEIIRRRRRLPRYLAPGGALRCYLERDALAQYMMHQVAASEEEGGDIADAHELKGGAISGLGRGLGITDDDDSIAAGDDDGPADFGAALRRLERAAVGSKRKGKDAAAELAKAKADILMKLRRYRARARVGTERLIAAFQISTDAEAPVPLTGGMSDSDVLVVVTDWRILTVHAHAAARILAKEGGGGAGGAKAVGKYVRTNVPHWRLVDITAQAPKAKKGKKKAVAAAEVSLSIVDTGTGKLADKPYSTRAFPVGTMADARFCALHLRSLLSSTRVIQAQYGARGAWADVTDALTEQLALIPMGAATIVGKGGAAPATEADKLMYPTGTFRSSPWLAMLRRPRHGDYGKGKEAASVMQTAPATLACALTDDERAAYGKEQEWYNKLFLEPGFMHDRAKLLVVTYQRGEEILVKTLIQGQTIVLL